jgi:shikimate 5-dehydrogenase
VQLSVYCLGPNPADCVDTYQQLAARAELPVEVRPVQVDVSNINRELSQLLREESLLGAVIERPFRQTALAYCQELSHAAQVLGSVTVLVRRSSGLVYGDHTDLPAFVETLAEAGVRKVRTALVLGAGQAARTALAGLRELHCARYLVGYRNPRRPAELGSQLRALKKQLNYFPMREMDEFFAWTESSALFADRIPLAAPGKHEDGVKRWDLLVNATPVGCDDADGSLVNSPNFLRSCMRVLDMVPRAEGTPLLRAAEAAGVPTVRGCRLTALSQQYAVESWARELRRRKLTASGSLERVDEPRMQMQYGAQSARVPVLKRRQR